MSTHFSRAAYNLRNFAFFPMLATVTRNVSTSCSVSAWKSERAISSKDAAKSPDNVVHCCSLLRAEEAEEDVRAACNLRNLAFFPVLETLVSRNMLTSDDFSAWKSERVAPSQDSANSSDRLSAVHCCSSLRLEEAEEDVKLVVVLEMVVEDVEKAEEEEEEEEEEEDEENEGEELEEELQEEEEEEEKEEEEEDDDEE